VLVDFVEKDSSGQVVMKIQTQPDGSQQNSWYENGTLVLQGTTRGGVRVGVWREWDEDGNPGEQRHYGEGE